MTAPLYLTKRDRRRSTFGAEVAEFAEALGWVPMDWQREFWDTALEYRKTPDVGLGHAYARRQAVATVPRQNGKSIALLALAGWAAAKWPRLRVVWVAQERRVATENLKQLYELFTVLDPETSFLSTMGHERIRFSNGSVIEVQSATARAGHGASYDLAVLDETWSLSYAVLQSVVPSQAARPSALLCMISTQGTEESSVLNDLCERGRGGDERLTYMEYAARPDQDVFNQELWPLWMPALTQSTFVTVQAIADGAAAFSRKPKEFVRAYGNRMVASDDRVFTDAQVEAVLYAEIPRAPDRLWLGVDVSRGPDAATLAAAWTIDGEMYGRILERRVGADTSWVGPAVRGWLVQKPKAKVVVGAGASILVKDELEAFTDLTDLSFTSVAGAAMRFAEYVYTATAKFADAGGALQDALSVAMPKQIGDRWRFSRDVFGVDQTPIVALSLAVQQAYVDSFEPVPTINGIPIGSSL